MQESYEILSPDPFLRQFLADYEALSDMYRLVRAAYEPHVLIDKSFLRKTAQLVQKHTETPLIYELDRTHKLTEEVLDKLASDEGSDTVKVFNLIKALYVLVEQQGMAAPHLIPIGERAEQIARAFEERQLSTVEALEQLQALVREYKEAEQSRTASDLSTEGFATYWLLRREGLPQAEQVAREIEPALKAHPHWQHSAEQERQVRMAMYKALLPALPKARDLREGSHTVVDLAERIIALLKRARA